MVVLDHLAAFAFSSVTRSGGFMAVYRAGDLQRDAANFVREGHRLQDEHQVTARDAAAPAATLSLVGEVGRGVQLVAHYVRYAGEPSLVRPYVRS